MILARYILRKFDMQILQICAPHLSDVATLPWKSKKNHFQQYYLYMLLTGEVNKSVRFSCQIFSVFNVPKIIKNRLIFDRVIQKTKRWTFFGTQ